MKITDTEDNNILITDFENFFSVYEDRRGNYSYNLNETMYLDVDEDVLQDFTCDCECFWPLISYKIYKTTRLAWLLMKINGVQAEDMFEKKMPGEVVKYLPKEYVNGLVGTLNGS